MVQLYFITTKHVQKCTKKLLINIYKNILYNIFTLERINIWPFCNNKLKKKIIYMNYADIFSLGRVFQIHVVLFERPWFRQHFSTPAICIHVLIQPNRYICVNTPTPCYLKILHRKFWIHADVCWWKRLNLAKSVL